MICQVARPRTHDEQLRIRLVDEAGRLLSAEGPAALTTRRLADRAATSSSAVYSLFGDKGGLIRAMFSVGFQRLVERFDAVHASSDPVADLLQLGWAFRANALANPHLYDLMFSCPFPEFTPGDAEIPEALGTFQVLVDCVQRCLDDGVFASRDPFDVALLLFGLVDGLAGLELRDWLGSPEEAEKRWEMSMKVAVAGLRSASAVSAPAGGEVASNSGSPGPTRQVARPARG